MKRKIITTGLIVGISILLWVFVSFSGEYSITLNLPVAIKGVPEDNAISFISTKEVTLNVKGNGWQLAQNTFGRNQKFFIQSPSQIGSHTISSLSALNVNSWLASSLQLTKIIPEKIDVYVEKIKVKKVSIRPNLNLEYKPDYGLVSKIKLEPDSVLISGPESLINNISFVNTVNEQYFNLEKSISTTLKLQNREFLKLTPSECKVHFDVQKIVDKTFSNIDVLTKDVPTRYDVVLFPNKLKIVLRGGIILLSKLKNNDIKAYVKFNQALNDTSGAVEPSIEIPAFTTIIDQSPKSIDYIIKKY